MSESNRNLTTQTKHDQMVLRIAREYEGKDYKVYADIEGYRKPPIIGGYRPDVLAVKHGHRTIVEVETLDSVNTHHAAAQDGAFRRACRRSPTTSYKRVIAQGLR